jgi:hypothetical protein
MIWESLLSTGPSLAEDDEVAMKPPGCSWEFHSAVLGLSESLCAYDGGTGTGRASELPNGEAALADYLIGLWTRFRDETRAPNSSCCVRSSLPNGKPLEVSETLLARSPESRKRLEDDDGAIVLRLAQTIRTLAHELDDRFHETAYMQHPL